MSGGLLLCKHEPDAAGMLANDCLFEFVGHWLYDALLSIKRLDVVCFFARPLEDIGQPTLLSPAADRSTDKA